MRSTISAMLLLALLPLLSNLATASEPVPIGTPKPTNSVSLTAGAMPARGPWCAVPLDKWTEGRTLDSCTEAMTPDGSVVGGMALPVPTPPYGLWKEQNGTLEATGLANCWSTMLLPGDRHDLTIATRFTVRSSSQAARQLPGGCVRWGFHWGENLPGWDVGVVVGYQDPLNFYRVQLSAARGELALWGANGGFLQLIPCKVDIGSVHELTIGWRGAHLTAVLDGKQVMDYWVCSLPYTHGQVGLTVWKSDVQLAKFAVTNTHARAETMPVHVPDFHFAQSDNLLEGHPSFTMFPESGVILFDGNEPISYFMKLRMAKDDNYSCDSLMQEAVKLKPGWRAAYYTLIGPNGLKGYWRWPLLVGNLPEAFKVSASGKRLVFAFQTETPGTGCTDYLCTVTFDSQRGVYRYEYHGTLKVTAPATVNEFELFDPLTYNNRSPGPEVTHRWNPAGHRWFVYPGTSGAWERMPLTDYPNEYSTEINNAVTPWGKVTDFLYPDPAACPVFETEFKWPKGRFSPGQCAWGYDFHHRVMDVGSLKAGDVRSFSMAFTAMPPTEAAPIFTQSTVMPCLRNEKHQLLPFTPTGTTFADTTTWQAPSTTMVWIGGTRDDTTGHGAPFSLRIDGPGKASVKIYHYMLEQYAKRWWIRGWYKTKDLQEPGLRLHVGYFDPPPVVKDEFQLGNGTHDWTYFSFTTDVFGYRDITDMIFELQGNGQAWLDDVAVSALTDDQQPKTTGMATR